MKEMESAGGRLPRSVWRGVCLSPPPVYSRVILIVFFSGWFGEFAPPLQAQQSSVEDIRVLAQRGQIAQQMTAAQVAEARRLAELRQLSRGVEAAPTVDVPGPSREPLPEHVVPRRLARAFLMVSGMYQATTTSFTDSVTFVQHDEEGYTATDYSVGGGPAFDVMAGFKFTEYLGVGAGVTSFARSDVAGETAVSAPHRFYYNRHRTATGPAAAGRQELAFHLLGFVVAPVTDRVSVTLFGGPSLFQVRQGLVTEVNYTESFPYNAISFGSTVTVQQSMSSWGVNVGADVSMLFSPHVGIGGLVRFSRATFGLLSSDNDTVTAEAGGLQVGGGVRFYF
mgnify:CR=1 FL=1